MAGEKIKISKMLNISEIVFIGKCHKHVIDVLT